MTPDTLFSVANSVALVSWLLLALFQRRPWTTRIVIPAVVTLLALAYGVVIGSRWSGSEGGFSTLSDVALLFADRWLLLAGWLHYLAFDLLVGRWEVREAAELGIHQWIVVPFLLLTFMFGPAGWLAFMLLRTARSRSAGRDWY